MKPIDRSDLDAVEDFTMIFKFGGLVVLFVVVIVVLVGGLLGFF